MLDDPLNLLTIRKAAEALDMSVTSFRRYVLPDLRVVRRGTLVRIPRSELQRWVDTASSKH